MILFFLYVFYSKPWDSWKAFASAFFFFASTVTLSHCKFTKGNFLQQTCVADVAFWVRSEGFGAALPDKVSGGKANACCLSCDTFPTADKYTGRCILLAATVFFFTEDGHNSTKTRKPADVSGINTLKSKIPLTRNDHRACVC